VSSLSADAALVVCPYCGQAVELVVDTGGGSHQEYIEDCEVCCRPWRVQVLAGEDGFPDVVVSRLDD
jgi:hypothetical protein